MRPNRHSFTRIPDRWGWTHCLRCGLVRRRLERNRKEFLDRMGWTDKAPPCVVIQEERARRLVRA